MAKIAQSLTELVGNTPILELKITKKQSIFRHTF